MDRQTLDNLKEWFSAYCRTFSLPDPEERRNISLKEEHTHRVCDNMTAIAAGLSLDEGGVMLAESVALFHDVGRFSQYLRYRTFNDSVSVNHAALGARVLIEDNVLEHVELREQALIIRAVTLHNVFVIPGGLDPESLLFLKMVRDADKLDIWRIFIEQSSTRPEERASAVNLGLPDTAVCSAPVLEALRRKELVQYSSLRTVNDFRLLQLAWVFDLNFDVSLRMVAERRYIEGIASLLPDTGEIRDALDFVRQYLSSRLRSA